MGLTQLPQKQRSLYLERLDRFISPDFYSDYNLLSKLVLERIPITTFNWYPTHSYESIEVKQILSLPFEPFTKNTSLKTSEINWFELEFQIPETWSGKKVYVHWKAHSEGLVYNNCGDPINSISEMNGWRFLVSSSAKPNQTYRYLIELSNPKVPLNFTAKGYPSANTSYSPESPELLIFNENVQSLYRDFRIIRDMARTLPETTALSNVALWTCNKIINIFDRADISHEEMWSQINTIVQSFLNSELTGPNINVVAVGNCHIDTAWLWTFSEAIRKCARSWSAQLTLMDQFPKYVFACSQMQQLDWIRSKYPSLFVRMQEKHKAGQFVPVGGSWVEMDGNMPSGESFARQFLYGQRFSMQFFDHKSSVFWLPDTFGYNAQLPQLMLQAGMSYFLSQKLSWNKTNKFPHTSFWWIGLDGSRVLAHFPPSDTYTSQATVSDIQKCETQHRDKDRSNSALLLYGHGDGGGGPNDEMVENICMFQNTAGSPKVDFGNPETFFKQLKAKDGPSLLSWEGELYLEIHRGTLTSQAKTKYYNRSTECLLRETEIACIFSCLIRSNMARYPVHDITNLWKTILLCQFHDVLAGSSINDVYKETDTMYEKTLFEATKIRELAFRDVVRHKDNQDINKENSIALFNSIPFCRTEVLLDVYNIGGSQPDVSIVEVPGLSISTLSQSIVSSNLEASIARSEGTIVLENNFVRACFTEKGLLFSLVDKAFGREIITSGQCANRFTMYEDVPYYWDAWDVEPYYAEKGWYVGEGTDISCEILKQGPILVSFSRKGSLTCGSTFEQVISLSSQTKLLEFTCKITWSESHKLLKLSFPLKLKTGFASYECPFGVITRSIVKNNSWQSAKFEVCAHKFVDLSEYNYGVAILNDGKYGVSVSDSTIDISILRAPKFPDDNCDIGEHVFRIGVFPHSGCLQDSSVVGEAYKFNNPLRWASSKSKLDDSWINKSLFKISWETPCCLNPHTSNCHCDSVRPPLVIDAIKKAEDTDAIVIRAYEPHGGRGVALLHIHSQIKFLEVRVCNILENEISVLPKDALKIAFEPFKVYTLKCILA